MDAYTDCLLYQPYSIHHLSNILTKFVNLRNARSLESKVDGIAKYVIPTSLSALLGPVTELSGALRDIFMFKRSLLAAPQNMFVSL